MNGLELLRRTRFITLASLLAFAAQSLTACAPVDEPVEYRENDESTFDEVTDISHTVVKRQSIGNCWIYATAGWIESLRLRYNGEQLNVSESYITYWDWYDKLTKGEVSNGGEIETGGWWGRAGDIILQRGLMMEGDFLPEEATMEMSQAQRRALTAINESIRSGALSTPEARRDGTIVRRELDRAFGLRPELIEEMNRVFGPDGRRTLADARVARRFIKRPTEIVVGTARTSTGGRRNITLADVIGTSRNPWNPDQRRGAYAWNGWAYPRDPAARREFIRRVQRAMNDGHPVIISWLVDFNALDNQGAFRLDELQRRGIGRQGGHLTVLEDYVVDNVPGYGTLGLGLLPPEQREAALQGTVRFFRIKNSWGANRTDRASQGGYYDLYMDYLNGPITWREGESDNAPTTQRTPLSSVVLPPGY